MIARKGIIMLRKIETRELMTTSEAKKKYSTQYIIMELTGEGIGQDNQLGYVLYTADKDKDKRQLPKNLGEGGLIAFMEGYACGPIGVFGDIVYHGED